MPELGSYGSVRGAAGNSRPYRERRQQGGSAGATDRRPKAPRHEVAGSWAPTVQRVLWGFDAGAELDERRGAGGIRRACLYVREFRRVQ